MIRLAASIGTFGPVCSPIRSSRCHPRRGSGQDGPNRKRARAILVRALGVSTKPKATRTGHHQALPLDDAIVLEVPKVRAVFPPASVLTRMQDRFDGRRDGSRLPPKSGGQSFRYFFGKPRITFRYARRVRKNRDGIESRRGFRFSVVGSVNYQV